MNSKPRLALYLTAVIALASCTRDEILTNLDASKDCEVRYAAEKRMKKITSTTTATGSVRTWEFSYLKNAIKEIATTSDGSNAGSYVIQYASGICIPSGYNFQFSSAEITYDLNGIFTIDKTQIKRRTMTPNYRNPFTSDSSNSNVYAYDVSGKINSDVPGFSDAPLYDNVINVTYSPANNVNTIHRIGGSQEVITTNTMDTKKNPFKQQDKLLYLMKLLPLSTFNRTEESVFHYFSLNNNNPLRFQYINPSIQQFEYTLEYTYTPDSYPLTINIYRAAYTGSPTVPDTRVLVETVAIE
ncbi:MAG: hypothetical protein ACJ75F_06020, partial [Flavisolibacter sp.]